MKDGVLDNGKQNEKEKQLAVSEYPICMAAKALAVDLAVIAKVSFWQQPSAQGVGLQNYQAEQAA